MIASEPSPLLAGSKSDSDASNKASYACVVENKGSYACGLCIRVSLHCLCFRASVIVFICIRPSIDAQNRVNAR